MKKFIETYNGYHIFKDKFCYMVYVKGELIQCFGTLEDCKNRIDEKLEEKEWAI